MHVWQLADGLAVRFRNFHDRKLRLTSLVQQVEQPTQAAIASLSAALRVHDGATAAHGDQVAELSVIVGAQLGLSDRELAHLHMAARFHDLGKIGVPASIINKPGPLTPKEVAIVHRHPEMGEEILRPLAGMEAVLPIVRHAHERWDGAGYPDGLRGEAIPFGARIVLAVDAYDAMTSDRSYRAAMTEAEAEAELRQGIGAQFDPLVVGVLLSVLRTGWPRLAQPGSKPRRTARPRENDAVAAPSPAAQPSLV